MEMDRRMRRNNSLLLIEFFALAFLLLMGPGFAGAAPVGTFPSELNAVGQTFWGDGAVYKDGYLQPPPANTKGEKCLECHQPGTGIPDKTSYLLTGHGNMVKKVSPGQIWKGATKEPHAATNPYGHVIDWSTGSGRVNLGGFCDVGGFEGQFNKEVCEATKACTLAKNDFFSPAYSEASCVKAGGQWKLGIWTPADRWVDVSYFIGDWMGSAAGHVDTGITGATLPANKFMMADGRQYGTCGSCHNTGYKADYSRIQPYADNPGFKKDSSSGALGSWVLNGIQCERCHDATPTLTGGKPTVPKDASSTAICSQCHIRVAGWEGSANPNAATQPTAYPIGASATNIGTHLIGKQFLNSPHGLFTGPYGKIATTNEGLYNSTFSPGGGLQGGCDTCHDVHQSTVKPAKENFHAEAMKKTCDSCHPAEAQTMMRTHRSGPGTMLPTGTAADVPEACVTCHMPKPVAGEGLNLHVFRINTDPNYSTLPKAGATTPGYCSDPTYTTRDDCLAKGKSWSLVAYSSPYGDYANAVWVDVDLACGQCHVGSGAAGIKEPINGARQIEKVNLAKYATLMHGNLGSTIHAIAKENGTITPAGTTKVKSGGSQSYTITPNAGYQVQDVVVDGVSKGAITSYTFNNVTNSHTITAYFQPATFPIEASWRGPDGSGSISPEGTTMAARGSNVTYTMTPAPGYKVGYVVVDGRNVGAPAGNTYTFTNVQWSHSIKAYFKVQ